MRSMDAMLINEWMKVSRRSPVLWVVAFGPLLMVVLGAANFWRYQEVFLQDGADAWSKMMLQITLFYAVFFYPVLPGVLAALVCRYEHLGGGWKQQLALPVRRRHLFGAKLAMVALLLALTQGLFYLFSFIAGEVLQLPEAVPWRKFFEGALYGWLSALPLAALQLALSVRWKSFALPLAMNVMLSLPALIVVQSRFAPVYPWAQPALAMLRPLMGEPLAVSQFLTVVLGGFFVFVAVGLFDFCRRDVV